MKFYELPCTDSRKSFYGKAQVAELEDGSKILKSYSTIVASMDALQKGDFSNGLYQKNG